MGVLIGFSTLAGLFVLIVISFQLLKITDLLKGK